MRKVLSLCVCFYVAFGGVTTPLLASELITNNVETSQEFSPVKQPRLVYTEYMCDNRKTIYVIRMIGGRYYEGNLTSQTTAHCSNYTGSIFVSRLQ